MKKVFLFLSIITVQWFLDFKENYTAQNHTTFIRKIEIEKQIDVAYFLIRAPEENTWWDLLS